MPVWTDNWIRSSLMFSQSCPISNHIRLWLMIGSFFKRVTKNLGNFSAKKLLPNLFNQKSANPVTVLEVSQTSFAVKMFDLIRHAATSKLDLTPLRLVEERIGWNWQNKNWQFLTQNGYTTSQWSYLEYVHEVGILHPSLLMGCGVLERHLVMA